MTDITTELRNLGWPLCHEAADEIERLFIMTETRGQEIERLRAQHQRIVDHYDMRSELYTNDADLAAMLTEIARRALEPKP